MATNPRIHDGSDVPEVVRGGAGLGPSVQASSKLTEEDRLYLRGFGFSAQCLNGEPNLADRESIARGGVTCAVRYWTTDAWDAGRADAYLCALELDEKAPAVQR